MTQHKKPLRIAGLLLASAALPLSPAFAQETQTAAPPAETTQPAAEPPATAPVQQAPESASPPAMRSEPVTNTRSSGREPASRDAAEASAEAPAARPARQRTTSTAARAPARSRAVAEPRAERAAAPVAAPAPEPAAVTAAPAPIAEAPPAPIAEAPPVAAPAPVEPAPVAEPVAAEENRQGTSIWPWMLAAALGAGALMLLLGRRRRRRVEEEEYVHHEPVAYEEPVVAPVPVAHREPAPVAHVHHEPVAAPLQHTHVEPIAAAAPGAAAAASAGNGRPWLDLLIRPVRAGVGEDAARVEFELGVENNGSAPAHDVRISTWLLPAGSGTEMERMLIEGGEGAQRRTETALAPGEATSIETTVALSRQGLVDAILPVVVADARYRLPDGSEGRTAASFAVGVPRGDDLVMFDVDNPSGMHEGVEARLHGEPRRD